MFSFQDSQLFKSQSALIKESIMQSGIEFQNEMDLQQFIANVNKQ